jgi:hypothetical protein
MTGVMNLNLTHSAVMLLQPGKKNGVPMPMSEICVPCHLGESCKRVHVLLKTEIEFKIKEPWDRRFYAF